LNLPKYFEQYKVSFQEFWIARDVRERKMLAAAAFVVILGLTYMTLIDPAMSGRTHLKKDMPVLRQQTALMQSLASEARLLSGRPSVPKILMTRENMEAALSRNSLKAQSMNVSGEFANVQLSASSFSRVMNWLSELQSAMKVSVSEARITPLEQADKVNATISLRQNKNE